MNQDATASGAKAVRFMVAAILAVFLASALGCAMLTESKQERAYNEAIFDLNSAYAELGKVQKDLEKDHLTRAKWHFNLALEFYSRAFENFAKAELPADKQAAVGELKKGFDKLKKCVYALERNDVANAQIYYEEAQGYFAAAVDIIDSRD